MQLYMDFQDPLVGALPPLEDVKNLCRDHFVKRHCRRGRHCSFQHVVPPGYSMEAIREEWKRQRDSSGVRPYGRSELGHSRTSAPDAQGLHRNDLQDLPSHFEEEPPTSPSVSQEQKPDEEAGLARNMGTSITEPITAFVTTPLLTCGICLEEFPPHGALIHDSSSARSRHHKFGLLSECNHSFCFQCLMDWRNPSFHHHVPHSRMGDDSQRMEGQKSCPICRKPSRYVIPSAVFPTSAEEKGAIVTRHKEGKSRIPCRYFNGRRGSCRFGSDCLYAHLNQRGHDVKSLDPSREELQQRRRNRQARRAAQADEEVILSLMEIAELHLVLSQIRGLVGDFFDYDDDGFE